MPENNNIPEFFFLSEKIRKDLMRLAANDAQKFFKNNFVKGGFTDTAFQAWSTRESPLGGKKTLYNKGNLMHSVRPTQKTESRVVITSDTPYSNIHNEGGWILVTAKMKKYWWAKYYQLLGKKTKTKKGTYSKTKGNKSLDTKAAFCKRMALMKVGTKIKIPKRQFMGESATLMHNLEGTFGNIITEIIK